MTKVLYTGTSKELIFLPTKMGPSNWLILVLLAAQRPVRSTTMQLLGAHIGVRITSYLFHSSQAHSLSSGTGSY